MHDTQTNFGANISVDHNLSCTARADDPGVGFWQWKTSTHDGKSTVLSNHTVCRYGLNKYNTPPNCPWNACLDEQCEVCKDDWDYVD